ncbi:MAG: hypothetical protein ACRDTH_09110 [Pseudonocardiaceae bacterium]
MSGVKWGLSVLDFHRHAIDDRKRHPSGCYKAECGHLLMMVTSLHEEPYGRLCGACAAIQAGRAVTRHDSDRPPVEPSPRRAPGGRSVPDQRGNHG